MEKPKRYLFVCNANVYRSPYATEWFSKYCKEKEIEIEVKSAGLNAYKIESSSRTPVQLTNELVEWADVIFVMENEMKEEIIENYKTNGMEKKKIFSLDIPDVFTKETSNPPFIQNLSVQEALDYLKENYDDIFEMGTVLFEKVLQGKLERILASL